MERGLEREMCHLFPGLLSQYHNNQDWAKLKLGVRKPTRVSHLGDKELTARPTPHPLLSSMVPWNV